MKKLLVICKDAPISNNGSAGGIRLYQILKILSQRYELYVICRSADFGIKDLEKIGCKYIKVNQSIDKEIIELNKCVDDINYALISFWYVAELYIPMLRKLFKDIYIAIDTVDLHFLRQERANSYIEGLAKNQDNEKRRELDTYKKANLCIMISSIDNECLLKEVFISTKTIPLLYDIKEYERKREKKIKYSSYFIGSFIHLPNVHSVEFILKEVFPKIKEIYKEAQIYIVGKHVPQFLQILGNEENGINFTGPEYDLEKFLAKMEVAMMPIVFGSGQNGKIVEAMTHKIPIITNKLGADGVGLENNVNGFIGNTVDEIVQKYIELMNMEDEQKDSIINNAFCLAKNKFDNQSNQQEILTLFEELSITHNPLGLEFAKA